MFFSVVRQLRDNFKRRTESDLVVGKNLSSLHKIRRLPFSKELK